MRQEELYRSIIALRFDQPGATRTFAMRLASEQGWSPEFTQRAIQEYRRFLYLAATGETPVTPSLVIDEVWHLHLLYTRSFWDDLCGNILGKPLHHDPSSGGKREDRRHKDQYEDTLQRYAEEFGHVAPQDLWRAPEPTRNRSGWPAGVSFRNALVACVVIITSVTAWGQPFPANIFFNIEYVIAFGLVAFVIYLLYRAYRNGLNQGDGRHSNSGCGAGGCGSATGSYSDSSYSSGNDSPGCGDTGGGSSCGSSCGGGGCGGGD